MPHVAIAGAGLAGRLTAWRFARRGWRVSLFDRAPRAQADSASHVAAAMLAPLAERVTSDGAVFELGERAMGLWPAWLDDLHHDSGRRVYHRCEGTLVLAHPADRSLLAHFEQVLRLRLPAAHLTRLQPLDGVGVGALEPLLAGRFTQGLHLAGEGQLANDELLDALAVALDHLRVEWHGSTEVVEVGERHVGTAAVRCRAEVVVDTRGVGARAAWDGLHGVRGEVITVDCPGVSLARPVRLMHPRYQLYIAPRPGHRFVVGATELDSEDDGPVALRSVLELGSALHSLHPAFGEARVVRLAAALRPALADHRPALQQHCGVWALNGLYRHGYLCALALVDDLVKAVAT